MKKIKKIIFPLSLVLLLAACNRNTSSSASIEPSKSDSVSSEPASSSESQQSESSAEVSSENSVAPSSESSVEPVVSSEEPVVSSEEPVVSSEESEQPQETTSSIEEVTSSVSEEPSETSSEAPIPAGDITLIDPEDTSMLTENCKAYIDAMHEQEELLDDPYKYHDLFGENGVTVEDYLDTGDVNGQNKTVNGQIPDRSDKNMGVTLNFESALDLEAKDYKVLVSLEDDFTDAIECDVEENDGGYSANVKNLFVNTEYFWKVVSDEEESDVASFTTGDYPRWISARPLYNVRDNGGYMTESGQRVKQGLVFRGGEITSTTMSGHYNTIADSSKEVFQKVMGIGFELDLRGSTDIYDGYKACAFSDEDYPIEYEMHAIKSYEETFTKTRTEVKPIFENILAHADEKPVYYHCFGGADRTGTLGFLLNGLLGVSYTDLVIDFELTSYSSINNEHIRNHIPGHQHQYDRWPALINQIKTDTTGGYAWDDDALLKDNIYNFLSEACNVDTDALDHIIEIMLED